MHFYVCSAFHFVHERIPQLPICVNLIYREQTLTEYFREYRAYHGLLPPRSTSKSMINTVKQMRYVTGSNSINKFVEYKESTVAVGPAKLKFHRTLRVPDNARNYLLPPV